MVPLSWSVLWPGLGDKTNSISNPIKFMLLTIRADDTMEKSVTEAGQSTGLKVKLHGHFLPKNDALRRYG